MVIVVGRWRGEGAFLDTHEAPLRGVERMDVEGDSISIQMVWVGLPRDTLEDTVQRRDRGTRNRHWEAFNRYMD